jgi:hypothetical protein
MTHRLMEGDLIENIKKSVDRIRLTLLSWEPGVTDWDVLWVLIQEMSLLGYGCVMHTLEAK